MDGASALIRLSDEGAGENCTYGGTRVDVGLDNGDGAGVAADDVLQDDEIDNTSYLCANSAPEAEYVLNLASGASSVATTSITASVRASGSLLTNGLFQDGLNNWTVQNGGNGWAVGSGGLFGNYAVGSYVYGEIAQVVDLTETVDALDLDAQTVPVSIGVFARKFFANDSIVVEADFLDESDSVLGTQTLVSTTVTSDNYAFFGGAVTYPVGTRKLRLVLGTQDTEFWAGHYAAFLSGPVVYTGTRLMRFSIDGGQYSAWESYAGNKNLTLPGDAGPHTVTAQVYNPDTGETTTQSDTVVLAP